MTEPIVSVGHVAHWVHLGLLIGALGEIPASSEDRLALLCLAGMWPVVVRSVVAAIDRGAHPRRLTLVWSQ